MSTFVPCVLWRDGHLPLWMDAWNGHKPPKNKTTLCGRGNDCFGSTFRVYHLSIAVPRRRVLKPKWGMRETFINPLTLPVQLTLLLLLSLNWPAGKGLLDRSESCDTCAPPHLPQVN